MNFNFGAVFSQIVAAYAKLPLAQKIAIPLLFVGSMGIITFVANWGSRPNYAMLYANLEESDAASVTEKLKADKVEYRLRDEGRTIDVSPADLVHQIRLNLASAGLPHGGSNGYELFNETALGMTGFRERVMLVRAIQGELERTILSITAVKSVRVHITSPEKSVFVKRDVLPTASVLLSIKPGEELTPQQIKGISYLVANSVERLSADHVTIVDSSGNVLNEQRQTGDTIMDPTYLTYRQNLETEYSRRIETMLAEILGPGRSVARVMLDLDFSKYEKEEEAFDPSAQVVRSERNSTQAAGLSAEGGVAGVVSNLTNDPGLLTAPDSAKNGNSHSEVVKNYEVSRAVSKTITSPGVLRKLSTAVLVDGQYETVTGAAAAEATPAPKEYKPLSQEMLRKIENLVKQAVGFDATRGDVVTVENIRFTEPDGALAAALAEADSQNHLFSILQWTLPAVFGLLFLFVVIRPLVKFLISPPEAEADLGRLLPEGIQELEAELDAERSKIALRPEEHSPAVNIEELEELIAENSRVVKENPQQAALLIRYWLNEGRA